MTPGGVEKETEWWALSPHQVLSILRTSETGLASSEVERRIEGYGPNTLPEPTGKVWWQRLLSQFASPFLLILLGVAILVWFFDRRLDATVIAGIVVLNALIGFFYEGRAHAAISKLRHILKPAAKVKRDGKLIQISAADIVPGDILILEAGDRVVADARIISAKGLVVDESHLTGESVPVHKEEKALPSDVVLADRKNMLFAGTLVVGGTGEAAVTATGGTTEFGAIAKDIAAHTPPPSIFELRLRSFGRILIIAVGVIAAVVFLLGYLRGEEILVSFLTSTALAVSLIPEGLPMAVTLALGIGVLRMSKRRAIVRRLSAVESLGAVTTLLVDKTGTLTKNEMTVVALRPLKGRLVIVDDGEFRRDRKRLDPSAEPDLLRLLSAGSLVTNADLSGNVGDPTELAILRAAEKVGFSKDALISDLPRVDEIPFDSAAGFMATLHRKKERRYVAVKGAPEVILARSDLTSAQRRFFLGEASELSSKALRVLAVAERELPGDHVVTPDEVSRLKFLGLIAMIDPPRAEAKEAVLAAKKAGIKVYMVTGDLPETAAAIAKMVGIEGKVVTGRDLDKMDDAELEKVLEGANIFARTTPNHKLRLVKAAKRRGEVVAVTGDGVNDAPALSAANIGVAMGKSGTDVAREASDLILADDNFATIVAAIEEGRTIYNNVQRLILYLISTSLGEALTIIGSQVIGLPVPVLPLQILWINIATDGVAGAPLAVEPKKERILSYQPRGPSEPILPREFWVRVILVGATMAVGTLWLFWTALPDGLPYARTIAFMTLIVFQLANMLNVRSKYHSIFSGEFFRNKWVIVALIVSALTMSATMRIPVLKEAFGTVLLGTLDWWWIVGISLTVVLVIEIWKAVVRSRLSPKALIPKES
jgi:Ca2+-transporting ATPase